MSSPNIEWLTEDDIWEAISTLQAKYREDPICVINPGPIEYVLNLESLSYFYDDDPLLIAATKIRTIIKGHPLLDGNKRLGMVVGTYFLDINGFNLIASDDSFASIAISLASGEANMEDLIEWIKVNSLAK
ncbi:Fic family protein [Aminithiophilus ramosus]|uniref:Fic family protein n=1 Tax=Aminithiophilus ramosus TaxID=3029084 RepID=A0A9Q7EWG1_9BACT|nr:type II toxin-antitoxin system death-on-curing family toxin [Aminithiophilus ramosus]QTX33248.1 Fic family protein [Aminithiophilus ramosus]